jgi:TPR repeat protein
MRATPTQSDLKKTRCEVLQSSTQAAAFRASAKRSVARLAWRHFAPFAACAALLSAYLPADDFVPAGEIELRASAEKGDPVAQFCLGNRYYAGGHKSPARLSEAEKWFRLSAAQGNPQAEERLGQIYFAGQGETQDFAEAGEWFRKAAEHGNRQAQSRLAQMYLEGKGVPLDREESKKWRSLAAGSLPPPACYEPAVVPGGVTGTDGAVLPDYPALRREAEKGDAEAQFALGERYYDERVRDAARDAEAQKWFRLAADQQNARAEDRLGWIYFRGNGVPQDYAAAAQWFRRAAEHGNLDAMTRLGNLYREGKGVPKDPDEGRRWINKASEIASAPARRREFETLAALALGAAAFAGSLLLLQRDAVAGWKRGVLASYVHVIGIVLVVNTLVTYGLPQLMFPRCSSGAWLATSCWEYKDLGVRKFATELHDWQMMNLIWRFMAMIGFILDILAVWYVVYLCRRWFGRRSARATT